MGCIHSDRDNKTMILVHGRELGIISFILYNLKPSTLIWTFKVPRMVRLGREVLVRLHKSRRAHREPSVDTVIGEVVLQVAFQEFVDF